MENIEDQMDTESNSSSSDESDEEKQDSAMLKRIEELERELSDNKFLYDSHVEVIGLYRKTCDLDSLREAYWRFHECFPLTPTIWLDWIRDEIKIAQSDSEKQKVFKLFDKAVEDYLSVDVWIQYAQYSIGISGIETTRSILERGLMVAGLHIAEGALLWDTYRELENAHLSMYQQDSDDWKKQLLRLAEIFKRQLSVPLIGMEERFEEWKEWTKQLPDNLTDVRQVEFLYNKAKSLLDKYKEYEDKLLTSESDDETYKIYQNYIKLVKDPSTVVCLYERAVLPLCLVPDLWWQYCNYAIKLGDVALKISQRSTRNCPWSEKLWDIRLRIMENNSVEESEILSCFEQGLAGINPDPGLNLWLTYLEYCNRHCEFKRLDKLFKQALEQFDFNSDPFCKISKLYASILVKNNEIPSARNVWNTIVSQPNNKGSSQLWLQYINFETRHGKPEQVRALFKRAFATKTDYPQCIAIEWENWERSNGDCLEVLKCIEIINRTINNVKMEVQEGKKVENGNEMSSLERNRKRKADEEPGGGFGKKTRKNDEFKPKFGGRQQEIEKDPKKTVFISNLHNSATETKLKELFPNAIATEIARDRKGKSRNYGFMQFSTEEEVAVALAKDRIPLDGRPVFISEINPDKTERKPAFKYSTVPECNKLFVKNIPVEKTSEEVKEIFKNYNPKDVRLVVKKSGESKGIAYVEFDSRESAESAMKALNGVECDDNKLSVSISAPPPKKKEKETRIEPVRHARSKLESLLVPRTVQLKLGSAKVGENGDKGKEMPKSNADFRNMLLKK